jgi:hypothetical protein
MPRSNARSRAREERLLTNVDTLMNSHQRKLVKLDEKVEWQ